MRSAAKSLLDRWRADYAFKTIAGSGFSLAVTVLFALYHGFLGIRSGSVWHGSICAFYLLLVAIRGMILLAERKNRERDERQRDACRRRTFLTSAALMLALNLALILPVSLMVVLKKPVSMGLIPAIATAAYTTYKVTMASVHLRKQRRSRSGNILVAELRTINFIDALVSILTLQNTLIMVNQTGGEENDLLVLTAVSSAVVYLAILWITLRLLIRGIRLHKSQRTG